MGAMRYKKFRETESQYYITKEGRLSRAEVIKRLETFIVDERGEGQDFFDEYEIKEVK